MQFNCYAVSNLSLYLNLSFYTSPKQVSAKKEKQAEKADAFRLQIFKWDLFSRIGHKSQIFKMHF